MSKRGGITGGAGGALAGFLAAAAIAAGAFVLATHYDEVEEKIKRLLGVSSNTEQCSARPVAPLEWAQHYEAAERIAYMQPQRIIDDVVAPLLGSTVSLLGNEGPSTSFVVADIGAGSGLFTKRLIRAFPSATVIATDTSASIRGYLTRCLAEESASETGAVAAALSNALVVPAGLGRPDLPQPAHVMLLCEVYHHLDEGELSDGSAQAQGGSSSHSHSHSHGHGQSHGHSHGHGGATSGDGRVAWLKAAVAQHDIAPGGFVVVIESREGDLPIKAPPPQMRLTRGKILGEFEAAGFVMVAAPDLLQYHHVMVFASPS